jgi:peptide/nickel transport system permease protein
LARYVGRRLFGMIPVLLIVSIIVFLLLHLAPGDPVDLVLGQERADEEVRAAVRAKLGLDQPLYAQYLRWVGGVLQGDLGYSFRSRVPVSSMILQRSALTIQLTGMAMILALAVSLPLGIVAAVRRNQLPDIISSILAGFGNSMPNFWLGILLIYLFAVILNWLPPSGFVALDKDPWGNLRTLILPTITLASGHAAVLIRTVRSSLLEVLGEDYIRTARSKGLAESMVLRRHALKNALIPVVTIIGMDTGRMLGGAVVTETIFALPGIGRLVVDGVLTRDFPVVQGMTLLMTVALLMSNLVVDVLYAYLDPRIRYGRS